MLVNAKRVLPKSLLLLLVLLFVVLHSCKSDNERAIELMQETRLIDGHNDLPLKLRWLYSNHLSKVDLRTLDTTVTNINKLQASHVGAQFWTLYILCGAQNKDAVRLTLEQIDVVKRMCETYDELQLVTSAQGIADTESNKIACLIGLEGGHAIDSSLATLRMYYALGVRYLTLTAFCNTPWAQTATPHKDHSFYLDAEPLAAFGAGVVKEMNRLGMIIDLTHASSATAMAVLELSKAPVIFSHTGAHAICDDPRNVPDDVLQRLKENKGILMVSFDSRNIACGEKATISAVADHFDHIKATIGSEYIGIGAEYDGMN
ncbi:UNVERIFIED_CONTAM: hypothetical protein K2H54_031350, partial [Gekko kuhli]